MSRTIKRTKTRSRKTRTRRHRGGFGQEQPVAPAPAPEPAPSLFQPSVPTQPVKPCGWWGALFGCPKTTTGGRKKHKKSVSFQR